jgi:hypothetical protein
MDWLYHPNSFLTAIYLQFSCGGGGSDGSKDSHGDLDTF